MNILEVFNLFSKWKAFLCRYEKCTSVHKATSKQDLPNCEKTGWSLVRSEARKRRSGGQNISQLRSSGGWGGGGVGAVPRGAFVVSLKLTLEVPGETISLRNFLSTRFCRSIQLKNFTNMTGLLSEKKVTNLGGNKDCTLPALIEVLMVDDYLARRNMVREAPRYAVVM